MSKIFLEGLPGAGKSSALEIIAAEGIPVMRELGLMLGLDAFPGNGSSVSEILAIDDWFINQEAERMQREDSVFDRSYFSHLTYAYGYGRYMGLHSLEPTVKKYEQAITMGKLTVPDAVVYIDIEPELSIERQHKRASMGVPLLDDFWMDKFFLQDLRDSYAELFNACTGIDVLVQNGENESDVIAHNITAFYDSLNASTTPQEPEIHLGRYIMDLEGLHDC